MTADREHVTVELRRGWAAEAVVAQFAAVGVLRPNPAAPVTGATLVFVTDEEHEVNVSIGETFPVRDQVWRLDEANLLGDDDYRIVISRVTP